MLTDECRCLDCEGFCFWDGDYCCTKNMKILSHCDETGKALNPEKIIEPRECNDFFEDSEDQRKINYDVWEKLNS